MRNLMIVAALLATLPMTAHGEVKAASADAMLIEYRFAVAAPAAQAWESLVHPERWWPEDHTWSGKRASLSINPTAGGCFCERWAGGSAEHGRVVMVVPNRVLTLDAALGPFREMAISGILAIKLEERDGATTADVSYRVSGDATHQLESLAPIVDEVLGLQFGAFAAYAGRKE